jgi:hypothetical protein
MMKKLLLLGASLCSLVTVAPSAAARPTPLVAGAGYSTVTGPIVVNARATEPIDWTGFHDNLSAVGFVRAPKVFDFAGGTLDLSGTVTCMGFVTTDWVAVSGTLDTPLPGGTVSNFSLLAKLGGISAPWIWITPTLLNSGSGPCGTQLFFLAGLETTFELPEYHLTRGNLVINGNDIPD